MVLNNTCKCMQTLRKNTYGLVYIHTHIQICMYTYTRIHEYTYICIHIHTHTHTYIHGYIYMYIRTYMLWERIRPMMTATTIWPSMALPSRRTPMRVSTVPRLDVAPQHRPLGGFAVAHRPLGVFAVGTVRTGDLYGLVGTN